MATAKLYEYLKRFDLAENLTRLEQLDILGQLPDGDLRGLAKQAMLVLAERGRGPMENPITADDVITSALFQFGCLGRARSDEPVFVLRAQDVTAPAVVRNWAKIAADYGAPTSKTERAEAVAAAMREWQDRFGCKVPGTRARPTSPEAVRQTVAERVDRGDFVNRYIALGPAGWDGPRPSIAEKAIGKWSAVAREDEAIAGIRQRAVAAVEASIRTGRASVDDAACDSIRAGLAGVVDVDVEAARGLARASFGKRVGVEVAGVVERILGVNGVTMSDTWREALAANAHRIVVEEFKRIDDEGQVRP